MPASNRGNRGRHMAWGGPAKHSRTRLLVCKVPGGEQGRLSQSRPCPDDTGSRGNGKPSSSFKI